MSESEETKRVRIHEPEADITFTATARELADGMVRTQRVDDSGRQTVTLPP
jgi:hypothetical protein